MSPSYFLFFSSLFAAPNIWNAKCSTEQPKIKQMKMRTKPEKHFCKFQKLIYYEFLAIQENIGNDERNKIKLAVAATIVNVGLNLIFHSPYWIPRRINITMFLLHVVMVRMWRMRSAAAQGVPPNVEMGQMGQIHAENHCFIITGGDGKSSADRRWLKRFWE